MNDESEAILKAHYLLPVFLLIGTSYSMDGLKIGEIKNAVEEIKRKLDFLEKNTPDTEIRVSVLCFDYGARWEAIMESPSQVSPEFSLGGLTSMGDAFERMDAWIFWNALGKNVGRIRKPVFVMISGGIPTDDIIILNAIGDIHCKP